MFLNRKILTSGGGNKFRDEFSVAFDGTNDYLSMGDITLVDGLDDLTITCWIKPKTANRNPILSKGNYNGSDATFNFTYNLDSSVDSGAGRMNFSVGNSVYAFKTSLGAEADKWHHMAVTYSNTDNEIFFYLNGNKITPTATTSDAGSANFISLANTSKELKIGGDDSFYAEGNISEVTIYNTALNANQIKIIYNGREPYNHKEGVASNYLKAWYRMGDGILDNYAIICDETNATLGSNVISNGTFTSDSNWNKNSMWSISGGVAVSDGSGSNNINQSGSLIVGKLYKITFDIVSLTSGSGYSVRAGSSGTYSEVFNTIGTHTSYQMCLGSFNNIYINANGNAAGSIDKVKAQQIGGKAGGMINMSANDIEGDTP